MRPARLLRILIAAVIAAALLYLFTPAGFFSREGRRASSGQPAAQRGGQVVGTTRSEPRSFNRLMARDQTTDVVSQLLQGRLVRINRSTFELEPWLADKWESSPDGLTHTFHLRPNLTWSDGTPFTSADVVFSLEAAVDPKVKSVVASTLVAGGQPIKAAAPDANTVVFTFAGPSGPGVRILDTLTIIPKHKLGAAYAAGTLAEAWGPDTPPAELAGMGPFVLREYAPGQRLIFDRNPRYWRTAEDGERLPYLDRIVLEVVPEQNAELVRLISGNSDFTHSELRPDDYVAVKRAENEGKVQLLELGVSSDADSFWFCLKPEAKAKDPRFAFLQKREFRQALSHAVDREAVAREAYSELAVPVWGPIGHGNKAWFTPNLPRYSYDPARARELLQSIGLEDRNNNGIVEDTAGTEAKFTVLTQRGITNYERATNLLREQAKQVGIEFAVVPLDVSTLISRAESCDFDAIYFRPVMSDLDPALSLDYWLSSGGAHIWNMSQKTPATDWEQQIDQLMTEQATTTDLERRKTLFNDVQRIFAENLPVLHFVAPRLYYAHSTRLRGVVPSILRHQVLWNADSLYVSDAGAATSR